MVFGTRWELNLGRRTRIPRWVPLFHGSLDPPLLLSRQKRKETYQFGKPECLQFSGTKIVMFHLLHKLASNFVSPIHACTWFVSVKKWNRTKIKLQEKEKERITLRMNRITQKYNKPIMEKCFVIKEKIFVCCVRS